MPLQIFSKANDLEASGLESERCRALETLDTDRSYQTLG